MIPEAPDTSADWSTEHRIAKLIETPAVRAALAACTANTVESPMSAEQFTASVAAALPMKHMRRLYTQSVERGRARSLNLGLKTGKQATTQIQAPIGRVTAATLCSLARNAQPIEAVEQLDDGCILTATIPSDAKTFGGTLQVELHAMGATTTVAASARIPGQVFDWGKSKKTLATLLADIPALLIR